VSFWRFAAGEFDEAGFGVSVKLAFDTVGFAAMNRRNPSFSVVFACVVGLGMTADVSLIVKSVSPSSAFRRIRARVMADAVHR